MYEPDTEEDKLAAIIVGRNYADQAAKTINKDEQLLILGIAIKSLQQAVAMITREAPKN